MKLKAVITLQVTAREWIKPAKCLAPGTCIHSGCHRAGRAGRRRKNHADAYAGGPAPKAWWRQRVSSQASTIQNDSELHAVGLYAEISACMKILRSRETLNLCRFTQRYRRDTGKDLCPFVGLPPSHFHWRLAGSVRRDEAKGKLGLAACTLVGEPKVLLLDEPGVGVGPVSRRELWQMVHELAGGGIRCFMGTSYLDEAERCRDAADGRRLLYQGEPKALTTMAGVRFHE